MLSFLVKHLLDFRFYPTWDYVDLNVPAFPYINVAGALQGHVFTDPNGETVKARDLYTREVAVFKDLNNASWTMS